MPTDDDLHSAARELLQANGHRYTSARRRIVVALQRAPAPTTLPQLIGLDSELAQSSAYRNLALLEEVGVVTRLITLGDHARYELDERVTNRHHHHLVCVECGDVRDFELSEALERTLEREIQRAGRAVDFTIADHRLDLLGTCARCE